MSRRAGRPSKGLEHIDGLSGDEELKTRLRGILATLTEGHTVREVAKSLKVGESRLHELRRQALQAALDGIAPRPPGRPPQQTDERDELIGELERQLARMEAELQLARARAELALVMPNVLEEQAKKGGPRARRRLPRPSPESGSSGPKKDGGSSRRARRKRTRRR